MRFVALSLIINLPDPNTGMTMSQHDTLTSVFAQAELVERLCYDAYQIGERHGAPFLCSSPPVLLTAVAARTSRVRLLTDVTVLSIHDPVRVAEEYALFDHLSGGRLDLVIAKGNHAPYYAVFGLDPAEQWDVLAEKYETLPASSEAMIHIAAIDNLAKRITDETAPTWQGTY
ncbi:LLM class flavin-dependent oxidoreductase [Frankia sp. Cppng1_Ct_nod]|uniref:LLM class flavin-dependent oxidoreductase n=1 Tax=Frankia sp. Cppng1_Ct_nod TaxID=2897162 RepID=UPI001041583F|nr:LLM class flavin-dependent oxidoreductase [Frankia sp. Cppng1_Ct_nod]